MRPPHVNEIHHSNARTLLTSLALSTHDTVRAQHRGSTCIPQFIRNYARVAPACRPGVSGAYNVKAERHNSKRRTGRGSVVYYMSHDASTT